MESDGNSYWPEPTVFNSNANSNADSDADYNANSITISNNTYKAPA